MRYPLLTPPVALAIILCLAACGDPANDESSPAQRTGGDAGCVCYEPPDRGGLTEKAVHDEARRLPPVLRERFRTEAGGRELARAMQDKELLAREAYARGYAGKPEIREEVLDLQERIIIKAMLEDEENKAPISDAEVKSFFDANREEFAKPVATRISRFLARHDASSTGKLNAKKRAEAARSQLLAGTDRSTVFATGDGPERVRGGDLGFVSDESLKDAALSRAVFSLPAIGDVSSVIDSNEGFAVIVLVDKREAGPASFEEVREEARAAMSPRHKRRVFEELIKQLRVKYAAEKLDDSLNP